MRDYVAIDFETTSFERSSACSIGLMRFDSDGNPLDSYYSLIKPKRPVYNPVCMNVHNIPVDDIESSPSFRAIWPEVASFIGDSPLVAHNAEFDISVLRCTMADWNISGFEDDYYCTLSLSKKIYPELKSHKLTSMASIWGWKYDAHNALADAYIAGRLFYTLCNCWLKDEKELSRFMGRVYKSSKNPFPRHLDLL